MIRFNSAWTYHTPAITREFPKDWEGDDITADQRKAALAAGVAEELAAKANDKPVDGKR